MLMLAQGMIASNFKLSNGTTRSTDWSIPILTTVYAIVVMECRALRMLPRLLKAVIARR
jgi:hypothetical protein